MIVLLQHPRGKSEYCCPQEISLKESDIAEGVHLLYLRGAIPFD